MKDIDVLLSAYKPGEPAMKPDVLKQIKEIDAERGRMAAAQAQPQIMIEKPGEGRRPMTAQEIIALLGQQHEQIRRLNARIQQLESGQTVIRMPQEFTR